MRGAKRAFHSTRPPLTRWLLAELLGCSGLGPSQAARRVPAFALVLRDRFCGPRCCRSTTSPPPTNQPSPHGSSRTILCRPTVSLSSGSFDEYFQPIASPRARDRRSLARPSTNSTGADPRSRCGLAPGTSDQRVASCGTYEPVGQLVGGPVFRPNLCDVVA